MQSPEIRAKARQTNLDRYGVDHPSKDREIALKTARARNKSTIKYHWDTGEELVCVASYETRTVDYLNSNKINFQWHPKTFTLSTGRRYTPDLYLVDEDLWIEIKGYFLDLSFEKWTEFHNEIHPNSELWNTEKLKSMGII